MAAAREQEGCEWVLFQIEKMGEALAESPAIVRRLAFINPRRIQIALLRNSPQVASGLLVIQPVERFHATGIHRNEVVDMLGEISRLPNRARFFLLPWAENQPWAVSVPCGAAFGFIELQAEILFR